YTDRELRDYVVEVRKQLLQLPDVTKIDILGAQDERVYIEFSTEQLAGLGVDRAELSPRCTRRTPSPPRASSRPRTRRFWSASRVRSGPSRTFLPSILLHRTAGSFA